MPSSAAEAGLAPGWLRSRPPEPTERSIHRSRPVYPSHDCGFWRRLWPRASALAAHPRSDGRTFDARWRSWSPGGVMVRCDKGLLRWVFAVYAGPSGVLADLLAGRLHSRDTRKMAAAHAARPASVVTATHETAQLAG